MKARDAWQEATERLGWWWRPMVRCNEVLGAILSRRLKRGEITQAYYDRVMSSHVRWCAETLKPKDDEYSWMTRDLEHQLRKDFR
jgi:hypothetical protein